MSTRYIGLAGLGFLGRGIATCLVEHGFHVVALEPNQAAWETVTPSEHLLRGHSGRDFADCELIIETITESLPEKQALFEEIELHVGPAVPIGSNTSSIPITTLQLGRKHPNRFAGMHWSAPAEATRFLEIIRGGQTDDATLDKIVKIAIELDKSPGVVHKDLPGFVANRIAYAMYREAINLLEDGVADAETIDLLCRHSLGLWTPICGPFRWIDISGGPALYAKAMERIVPTLSNESEVPKLMRVMQGNEDRGTRNGRGFYEYGLADDAEWQRRLHEQALRIWELSQVK